MHYCTSKFTHNLSSNRYGIQLVKNDFKLLPHLISEALKVFYWYMT